jgi:hypothetical protein
MLNVLVKRSKLILAIHPRLLFLMQQVLVNLGNLEHLGDLVYLVD